MKIITTHRNTDFDALASVMAGTLLMPEATPVIPKNVNPNVKAFLSIHKDIFEYSTPDRVDQDSVEKVVVMDVNRWERLEGLKNLKDRDNLEVALWDHHMNPGKLRKLIKSLKGADTEETSHA